MKVKDILKKTLPILITLVVVLAISLILVFTKKDKVKKPQLTDGSAAAVTMPNSFIEGGELVISQQELYHFLIKNHGGRIVSELIDTKILGTLKNADGKTYLEAVTETDIDAEIEKRIFPNGRNEDDPEANEKAIKVWTDNQIKQYGLRTEAARRAVIKLELARTNYSLAKVREEYKNLEQLSEEEKKAIRVTDAAIKSAYNEKYAEDYWAIVVNFATSGAAEAALAQLDITIQKDAETKKDVWYKMSVDAENKEVKTPMTLNEVALAFITLYNNQNTDRIAGYPHADPKEDEILREGTDYTVSAEGVVTFLTELNADENNELYRPKEKLTKIGSALYSHVKDRKDYVEAVQSSDPDEHKKVYSLSPKTVGSHLYYVFKISTIKPVALENVREELISQIVDDRNSAARTRTELAKLREAHNIVLYDHALAKDYNQTAQAEVKPYKKGHISLVAAIDDYNISADDIFKVLAERFAIDRIIEEYKVKRLLYSAEHNKIYNMNTKEVLDKGEWEALTQQADDVYRAFTAGQFAPYGYAPSFGWKNFLEEVYNVSSVEELRLVLLGDKVAANYRTAIGEFKAEDYETVYKPKMQEIYDQYFAVTGVHLLINFQDEKGTPINPEKWTDEQVAIVKEFYDLILDDLKTQQPDRIADYLNVKLSQAYNNTPYFVVAKGTDPATQPVHADDKPWLNLEPADYKYSKFIAAGVKIKFEDLNAIKPGQMVEPFEQAVKAIWDAKAAENDFGAEVIVYDKTYGEYLVTEFGYHIYVNKTTSNRPTEKIDGVDTVRDIPTKEMLEKYAANAEDKTLSAADKSVINAYYTPLATERTGASYPALVIVDELIADLANWRLKLGLTAADFEALLTMQRDTAIEGLKFFKP